MSPSDYMDFVKLAIIGALRSTGNSGLLSTIVSSTNSPLTIRTSALNSLTGILSPQDLWTLYEKESSKELKMQIVSAFGSMDAVDYLSRIVKSEKDPDVTKKNHPPVARPDSYGARLAVEVRRGASSFDMRRLIAAKSTASTPIVTTGRY